MDLDKLMIPGRNINPQINFDAMINYKTDAQRHFEAGLAEEYFERLCKMINDFQDELDEEHEVGVRLVSFGEKVVFHIERIGYWNPFLIRFFGKTDTGEPVELIQHVSQISVLLMKLKRLDKTIPKFKMGFGREQAVESPE